MGRLTSLMAMGVSLTSHNNPLLRHLIPSTSCVSRYSSFRRTTLFRNVAFTQGYVGYSTTTNSDGSQHSDSEGKLDSENNNAARMVPPVGQTEVGETTVKQVPVPRAKGAARWRELANEMRERNALIARNNEGSCYFKDSVPVMPDASSCGTSPKIDNGFQPRGSSTNILNKELTGVTPSGPIVTLPSNYLEVGTNVDVKLEGDGKQRPGIKSTRMMFICGNSSLRIPMSGGTTGIRRRTLSSLISSTKIQVKLFGLAQICRSGLPNSLNSSTR